MKAPYSGKIVVDVYCAACGVGRHPTECLPIPSHPGLAIAPPSCSAGAPGFVSRWSVTHIGSGASVLDMEGPEQAPMAVDFLDAEVGPIDWTSSAADIRAVVPSAGRGIARRWADHAGIRYLGGTVIPSEAMVR